MDKVLKSHIQPPLENNFLIASREYEVKETGKIRKRSFFAWYPVWLGMEIFMPLKGSKLTWLKSVEITEKEILHRIKFFEESDCTLYWGPWESFWLTIEIN